MPYIGRGQTTARFGPRNAIRTPDMTDTTSMKHQTPLTSGDFTAADEPFTLFEAWLGAPIKSEPNDPSAMALGTGDPDVLRGVRRVLMKGFDTDGFVFSSHIASQK